MKKTFLSVIISIALLSFLCSPLRTEAYESYFSSEPVEAERTSFSSFLDYQLDAEQLQANTNELLTLILNYPYLDELKFSNYNFDAYEILRLYFNGFQEFELRQDSASVMLTRIIQLQNSNTQSDLLSLMYLNALLSHHLYSEKLSAIEYSVYMNLLKKQCLLTSSCNPITHSYINDRFSLESITESYTSEFKIGTINYHRATNITFTTNGIIVPLYLALSELQVDLEADAQATASKFNVKYIDKSTSQYNCHSYAWYSSSSSNPYWIIHVENYISDIHCQETSQPRIGDIVVYYDVLGDISHSAVITGIDNQQIKCTSKWGQSGLFEHSISNVPATYVNPFVAISYKYYTYSHYHPCSVRINGASSHTRTCKICNWTSTEQHSINPKSGKCITCGYSCPSEISHENYPKIKEEQ